MYIDNSRNELSIQLPIWRGTHSRKMDPEVFEFRLGRDKEGFIRQTTDHSIIAKVEKAYNDDAYNYITAPPGASQWADSIGDYYYDEIKKFIPDIKKSNVLEIGGGSLYLGKKFVDDGAAYYAGIDPSIREQSNDSRMHVMREYFSEKSVLHEQPDLIISVNTLEHIPDPGSFLKNIRTVLLRKGGKCVLIFPDVETQFLIGDFNALLHEHTNYFTEASAKHLISNCGFSIMNYKKEKDTHFFLLEALLHSGRDDHFEPDILDFRNFERNLSAVKNYVESALKQNQVVAFHGATNGLNNILNLIDISAYYKNILIFDGDDTKAGKYIPMFPHAIFHSGDSNYKRADKVFITTSTFYNDIKKFLILKYEFHPDQIFPCFLVND